MGKSWMFYDDEIRRLHNGNPATQLPAYPLISLKLGSSVDAKIKADITAFKCSDAISTKRHIPN